MKDKTNLSSTNSSITNKNKAPLNTNKKPEKSPSTFGNITTAKGPTNVLIFEYSNKFTPQHVASKLSSYIKKCSLNPGQEFSSFNFAGNKRGEDGRHVVSISHKSQIETNKLALSFLIHTAKANSGFLVAARGELNKGNNKRKIRSIVNEALAGSKNCT